MVGARMNYSADEAAKRVGIPYSLLDSWARGAEPVVPAQNAGGGRGRPRTYTFRDLVALRIADELRLAGIRTPVLRIVTAYVRNEAPGLDTEDQLRSNPGVTIGVRLRNGEPIGKVVAFGEHGGVAMSVTIVVDVLAVARALATTPRRVLKLPPRKPRA